MNTQKEDLDSKRKKNDMTQKLKIKTIKVKQSNKYIQKRTK